MKEVYICLSDDASYGLGDTPEDAYRSLLEEGSTYSPANCQFYRARAIDTEVKIVEKTTLVEKRKS